MTYNDKDPGSDGDLQPTPGWLNWPSIPVVSVTLGSIVSWIRAWRNR